MNNVFRRIDVPLLMTALVLVALGVTFVFSATHSDQLDSMYVFKRQMMWAGVGIVAMGFFALLDYRKLGVFGHIIYALNILALIAVMFIGDTRLGAQRWIDIGPFVLQPSEFSKLGVAIALAAFLSDRSRDISDPRQLFLALLYVSIPILIIFKQPDLGTSLVVTASCIGILVVAGLRLRHFLFLAGSAVFAAVVAVKFFLQDYQLQRLRTFVDPSSDRTGAAYNVDQSQIAVGSGGFNGKGLFEGTQSTLNFLPHHDTDFIFSVIGEEWGFVGSMLLIALFLFLLIRIMYTSSTSRDRFGTLLAAGIGSMIFFQMTVNVGMNIGIMPVTGIPLPFISYGGSSMLTTLASVGILLSIYARRGA